MRVLCGGPPAFFKPALSACLKTTYRLHTAHVGPAVGHVGMAAEHSARSMIEGRACCMGSSSRASRHKEGRSGCMCVYFMHPQSYHRCDSTSTPLNHRGMTVTLGPVTSLVMYTSWVFLCRHRGGRSQMATRTDTKYDWYSSSDTQPGPQTLSRPAARAPT